MDLLKLNVVEMANQGVQVELTYPMDGKDGDVEFEKGDTILDDDGKAWGVTVLGSDSDTYRNAQKKRLSQKINQKKGDKQNKIDLDHEERKGAELLAKCTTSMYVLEGGKSVKNEFSEYVRVYLSYPWVREQVEKEMGDRSALTIS